MFLLISFKQKKTFLLYGLKEFKGGRDCNLCINIFQLILDQLEEMGSRSTLSRDIDGADHWEMNFHEAAIYLEVRRKTNYF